MQIFFLNIASAFEYLTFFLKISIKILFICLKSFCLCVILNSILKNMLLLNDEG